jgi:hypothetical protein
MGIFDKLKFWKKDDLGDLGLSTPPGMQGADLGGMPGDSTLGLGGTPGLGKAPDLGMPAEPEPVEIRGGLPPEPEPHARQAQYSYPQPAPSGDMLSKDMEVISSKLDALRATLDSINTRLSAMETNLRNKRGGW